MDRFIYTLPQEWYEDPNVAIKWKIYAIINGFWINKKPVFASNTFFENKLGKSKTAVQLAIKELEDSGLIERDIKGLERLILPGGTKSSLVGVPSPASPPYQAQLGHISISNSSNLHTSNSEELRVIEITTEDEERQPRTKTDTSYRGVFELWGKYPLHWRTNKTEIQAAKNLLEEHGLQDCKEALEFFNKHRKKEMCPQILKPSDLDRKYENLSAYSEKV